MKKTALGVVFLGFSVASLATVQLQDNQLVVDGKAQPSLFGAEIQYFRLRGGLGKNIPRAQVIEVWQKALDRAVEAHMNAVSFYIPWDFHEYAEGHFDFDGNVDEDGDGVPDYPSRDVKTFIKMILAHGIHHILIRPGPYINAEWGFLGFGAIPLWFHQKYPQSHCVDPQGLRTVLYNYHDPDFLRESKKWLTEVYTQVAKPYIGTGLPIHFVQLDNETNFMWQSIYNHDYSPLSVHLYQNFLRARYRTLTSLNSMHARSWTAWNLIQPPAQAGLNLAEDQDWYRFQDESIHEYLHQVRVIWENLGVREPEVLFTLAESYNAAENGLLPNFAFRNDRGRTGMMTVNLYPKTWGDAYAPLLNQPFKADLDVKSANSAKQAYLGHSEDWVMGPEIQGGWFPEATVAEEARRQTYLTTIGHGLKASFLYYFTEGENWQGDWAKQQITPFFEKLHQDPRYAALPESDLPGEFWNELNAVVHRELFVSWDATSIWRNGGTHKPLLKFDAPLGANAEPRAPFAFVKEFGQKVIAPYGDFLAKAVEATDPVCLVKDSASHVRSPIPGLTASVVNSDWAGGLLGLMMQAGLNPRILHWGLTPIHEFQNCRLIVNQDLGFSTPAFLQMLQAHLHRGGGVLNFLNDGVGSRLFTVPLRQKSCQPLSVRPLEVNGYECRLASGGLFYQVDREIYAELNSGAYATLIDLPARLQLIEKIRAKLNVTPLLQTRNKSDHVVVFGRRDPKGTRLWVTAKNGGASAVQNQVLWSGGIAGTQYRVTDVFTEKSWSISGHDLANDGFPLELPAYGSTAFNIEPIQLR